MFSKRFPTFPPDLYHVVCYDENEREKKFSCPKIAVTLCGETLVRHFENAINVEKPLVIKDFDAKTVKHFFFFVEHKVHILYFFVENISSYTTNTQKTSKFRSLM